MAELAAEYARLHPEDPLRMYYRGGALLAQGLPPGETIEQEGGPAAVWFVLGEAYAAEKAWPEAVICYEQARADGGGGLFPPCRLPDARRDALFCPGDSVL